MGQTIAQKIIAAHLVDGKMEPGCEVGLRIDQTLTQDATGTMAYLEYEAMGIPRVRTELSVAYIDHNTLQSGFMNADDHRFIRTIAKKIGVRYSRPGNGICHTVHVSRFGVPGKVSMGGDSHTPHGGAIGMLCIGVGGMDVATAMTGVPMRLTMPRVVRVNLTGKLRPGCNSKEVILEMLRRVTIKGGLGNVYEYVGPAVAEMEIPARATIANMGAEMGATTSIFPADEQVRKFMKSQGREDEYRELLEENIDLEYLRHNGHAEDDLLDEIMDLLTDTVTSKRSTIRIGGEDLPTEVVRSRLLKLDASHVEYVLDSLLQNTTKVRNIRAYLLTALYNAPTTLSSYYTALVNHDLYGDR